MLAVFDSTVAKIPEGLKSEGGGGGEIYGGAAAIVNQYSAVKEGAVTINLGPSVSLAYSTEKQNPFIPSLFASVDDIFCSFQGHFANLPLLKQQYGLGKTANEAITVIEAYRTLRDRGPYPADKVVRDFNGKFAFILFDSSTKTTFIAADSEGGVPFFWGTDSEGHMVFSDDKEIVKKSCGKSFAPFPKGCFFTTSKGLQSFEHPFNEVKPVPRVDSQGQVCGANYTVDKQSKKDTSKMPRVGSAADWSSQY